MFLYLKDEEYYKAKYKEMVFKRKDRNFYCQGLNKNEYLYRKLVICFGNY